MITKFKLFESIRDQMISVPMDDIIKMSSLSKLDWLFHLSNYDEEKDKMKESLPKEFFPTEEELKRDLAKLPNDSERIKAIIKHHLSYEFLPKGDLIINEEYLNWEAFELTDLPENLTINGNVNFGMNEFTKIKNLTVNGGISFHENWYLKKIQNVKVSDYLCLADCNEIEVKDSYVGGDLDISDSKIVLINVKVDGIIKND